MFQDWLAFDSQHRLRRLISEFLHPCAFAGGQDNGFHIEGFSKDRSSSQRNRGLGFPVPFPTTTRLPLRAATGVAAVRPPSVIQPQKATAELDRPYRSTVSFVR